MKEKKGNSTVLAMLAMLDKQDMLDMSQHLTSSNEMEIKKVIKNHSDEESDHDTGLVVQESRPEVSEPKKYMVILVNDDFTPMEFVVEILRLFFNLNEEQATRVMLNVHTKGKGVCGIFSKDIAETKVVMVNDFAQESEHPLLCTMEPE